MWSTALPKQCPQPSSERNACFVVSESSICLIFTPKHHCDRQITLGNNATSVYCFLSSVLDSTFSSQGITYCCSGKWRRQRCTQGACHEIYKVLIWSGSGIISQKNMALNLGTLFCSLLRLHRYLVRFGNWNRVRLNARRIGMLVSLRIGF